MKNGLKVLITEDDKVLKRFYQQALSSDFKDLTLVDKPEDAMDLFNDCDYDLLITDLLFSDKTGLDVINSAVEKCPEIKILVASGYVSDANYARDMDGIKNVKGYLQKPFTIQELMEKIESII